MKIPRQITLWTVASVLSLLVLGFVLTWQSAQVRRRWAVQVPTQPVTGSVVFRAKGCGACHGPTAAGTDDGPALRDSRSLSGLPQLVTAMWNHAPRMWQLMKSRHLPYPELTYDETSQLVSYLYVSGYADNGGDIARGEELFQTRSCVRCHSGPAGNNQAPLLKLTAGVEDPLSWTQALWNHASAMQTRMRQLGIAWPQFQARDMRDLFAYVRHASNATDVGFPDVAGDPERGWKLFQQKGCIRCHALSSESGRLGPNLGAERPLPPTFSEFGAALLNHFPAMQKTMQVERTEMPRFDAHDVTDMAVFLYSLHYLEPSGSPLVGKSVFAWRGCSRCHGQEAQGTAAGPALRGGRQAYTAVRLATDLWRHGGRMYQHGRQQGQPWPTLQDSDIGHLLTFLNLSPEQ